jgi:hypothetical protein
MGALLNDAIVDLAQAWLITWIATLSFPSVPRFFGRFNPGSY